MLQRSRKFTSFLSADELSAIVVALKLIDLAYETIFYKEFFYVYVDENKYTMEELSYKLCVSINSLKRHLNKISFIIQNKQFVIKTLDHH